MQKFFILLTQFIYKFYMYLATNSEIRPMQHPVISFLVETESVYSALRTGALNRTAYVSSLKVEYTDTTKMS